MRRFIIKYGSPFVLAGVLHFGVFLLIDRSWSFREETSSVLEFDALKAELLVLDPKDQKLSPIAEPVKKTIEFGASKEKVTKSLERQRLEEKIEKTSAEKKEIERVERENKKNEFDRLARAGLDVAIGQEVIELQKTGDKGITRSFQAKIYDQVKRNWSRPPSARNGMETKLLVELIPTGEVVSVSIVNSSGVPAFDRSAEQAVRRSRKFEVPAESRLFETYFRKFFFLFKPEDLLR